MELSVNTFVSLDGVMQGPGGVQEDPSNGFERGGWLVPHSDAGQLDPVDGWFRQADAFLLGRTTFEMMRTYWSQVTDPDNLVATALNTWRKYVVSNTLSDADAAWGNTTVLRGDVVEQVRRLKEQPGRELQVHGSWRLARTLHDAGLVDTYRLLQFPVVVGEGKRLFAGRRFLIPDRSGHLFRHTGGLPDHRVGGAGRGCGCGLAHPAPGRVRHRRHR
jgi:dihydrofolate reductase